MRGGWGSRDACQPARADRDGDHRALVVAGGAAATATVQSSSGRILEGVRIDGVDVGGMTRQQAAAALWRHVTPATSSKVASAPRGGSLLVTAAGLGRMPRIDRAVESALDGPGLFWLSRLWHRLTHEPVRQQVPLEYSGDAGDPTRGPATRSGPGRWR